MVAAWTSDIHRVAFLLYGWGAAIMGALAVLQGRGAADREQQGHSAYGRCGEE